MTDEEMLARNPSAYAKMLDVMKRIDAGELIDGYNSAGCSDGCGRVIEWKDFDQSGPDWKQPQGFRCGSCDQWFANECGDRKTERCHVCVTCGLGVDLRDAATRLSDALMTDSYDDVRRALAQIVGLSHTIGRRVRIAMNKPAKQADEAAA